MTNTERRIEAMLQRITYKPSWTLEVVPWRATPRLEWEGVPIMATFTTKDVESGKEIQLCMQESIHLFSLEEISDESLIQRIEHIIQKFEEHEFREWFKVDGVCVYDPHPEEKQPTYQLQEFQR